MTASFDTHELLANLTGLEKRARAHTPVSRLAGATSAELDSDLAAILTSARSRSAAAVEATAKRTDQPPPHPSSQSATVDPVPRWELGGWAAGRMNAFLRSYRRLARFPLERNRSSDKESPQIESLEHVLTGKPLRTFPGQALIAAPAILIVIGILVGGAGYMGVQALLTLEAPPALQEVDPPLETTAQAPAAEQAAEGGSTVAEAAALPPPSTEKAQAAVEPLAPLDHAAFGRNRLTAEHVIDSKSLARDAREKPVSTFSHRALAAPPTPEAPAAKVAKLAKPAKERKKPSADKSEKHESRSNRDAKSKITRLAERHRAHGAPAAPPAMETAEPAVVSDARRAAQKITGALKGLVDVHP